MDKEFFFKSVEEVLGLEEELTVDTKLEDIEQLDSLGVMLLITIAKEKFNKSITINEVKNCTTVDDILKLLDIN